MSGILNPPVFNALEQTLIFAQRRHTVLAGNLANISTPNYQARDLSLPNFQEALAQSISAQQQPLASPGLASKNDPLAPVRIAQENLLYHDGSDNQLEYSVTELAKNQMLHSTAINLLRSQFRMLETAISERV
jgi:flagellar basal-body rod protein FlgB